MTITIKTIKRSPTGRESVRALQYDGPDLLIGRDAASDLRLSALQVGLTHARLITSKAQPPVLELLGDNRVRVNKRLRSGRVSGLKAGQILSIGPFDLTIETVDGENVTMSVERLSTAENVITAEDEDRIFNLSGAVPNKRLMAWVMGLGILGVFLLLPIMSHRAGDLGNKSASYQSDAAWNSGPISQLHGNLKGDCRACHTAPFATVKDETCIDCHEGLKTHASAEDMRRARPKAHGFDSKLESISEAFGRSIDRCSSCHVEHNGDVHLMPNDQGACADCHKNLDTILPNTTLKNVSDFGANHPQFSPRVISRPDFTKPEFKRVSLDGNPKSFSGLKFPHKEHLSKTGAVPKMAARLGARYGFDDGVDCANCHRPEAGGALFDPVRMQEDCAMCHSIVFEDDEGYERTLRHGEPEEVIAGMRDFYRAKALGNIRDSERNILARRRPGQTARLRNSNRRERAFQQAENLTALKVEDIFSEGGACYDCHVIDRPVDVASLNFQVRPITVNSSFYDISPFNHAAHEIKGLTCASCHDAEGSEKAEDILLPKIDVCRDCHIDQASYAAGGKAKAGVFPTTCLTCHGFHGGPHGDAYPKANAQ